MIFQHMPANDFKKYIVYIDEIASFLKDITHNDYNNVLATGDSIKRDVVGFRSFNHQIYTVKTNKTALTAYYDKMFMSDHNTCKPFGYYKN